MKKAFYLLLTACLLCSCEGLFGPKETELEFVGTELQTIPAEGGTYYVTFSSNKDWITSFGNDNASSWCTISPESGVSGGACKVTINVAKNDTYDDRNATFYITAEDKYLTVNVTQKQKDGLTVTGDKFEMSSEGGTVKVEVRSNIEVTCTIANNAADWVSLVETKALESKYFTLKIDKNESLSVREATVSFSGNGLSEFVKIYQQGETPTLVLSPTNQAIPTEGADFCIEVTRNVPVEMEIVSGEDWLSYNGTKTISTDSFWFSAAENTGVDGRVCMIRFYNVDYSLSETVYVSQAQKDALVAAESEYTVEASGGRLVIPVGHNVSFNTSIDVDWITVPMVDTKAYTTEDVSFDIAANESSEERTGTITFTSADGALKQEIKVIQSGLLAGVFYESTIPGLYSYADGVVQYQYDESTAQLSLHSGEKYTFRILDPVKLRYMEISGMPLEMNVGDTFTAALRHNVSGEFVEKEIAVEVAKMEEGLVWLDSKDEQKGYLICR